MTSKVLQTQKLNQGMKLQDAKLGDTIGEEKRRICWKTLAEAKCSQVFPADTAWITQTWVSISWPIFSFKTWTKLELQSSITQPIFWSTSVEGRDGWTDGSRRLYKSKQVNNPRGSDWLGILGALDVWNCSQFLSFSWRSRGRGLPSLLSGFCKQKIH